MLQVLILKIHCTLSANQKRVREFNLPSTVCHSNTTELYYPLMILRELAQITPSHPLWYKIPHPGQPLMSNLHPMV